MESFRGVEASLVSNTRRGESNRATLASHVDHGYAKGRRARPLGPRRLPASAAGVKHPYLLPPLDPNKLKSISKTTKVNSERSSLTLPPLETVLRQSTELDYAKLMKDYPPREEDIPTPCSSASDTPRPSYATRTVQEELSPAPQFPGPLMIPDSPDRYDVTPRPSRSSILRSIYDHEAIHPFSTRMDEDSAREDVVEAPMTNVKTLYQSTTPVPQQYPPGPEAREHLMLPSLWELLEDDDDLEDDLEPDVRSIAGLGRLRDDCSAEDYSDVDTSPKPALTISWSELLEDMKAELRDPSWMEQDTTDDEPSSPTDTIIITDQGYPSQGRHLGQLSNSPRLRRKRERCSFETPVVDRPQKKMAMTRRCMECELGGALCSHLQEGENWSDSDNEENIEPTRNSDSESCLDPAFIFESSGYESPQEDFQSKRFSRLQDSVKVARRGRSPTVRNRKGSNTFGCRSPSRSPSVGYDYSTPIDRGYVPPPIYLSCDGCGEKVGIIGDRESEKNYDEHVFFTCPVLKQQRIQEAEKKRKQDFEDLLRSIFGTPTPDSTAPPPESPLEKAVPIPVIEEVPFLFPAPEPELEHPCARGDPMEHIPIDKIMCFQARMNMLAKIDCPGRYLMGDYYPETEFKLGAAFGDEEFEAPKEPEYGSDAWRVERRKMKQPVGIIRALA